MTEKKKKYGKVKVGIENSFQKEESLRGWAMTTDAA